MSNTFLLGLHSPGDTLLHRTRPSIKLIALFVLGTALVVVRDPWLSVGAIVVVLGLLTWAGISWTSLWRSLRMLLLMLAMLAGYHVWQNGASHAIAVVGGLAAVILAATLVTMTTPVDDMLDSITTGLGPFRRFGVDPERVALTFSLLLRAIPETMELAQETRDAARARGLDRNLRALLTPMLLRLVGRAKSTGEALHARGISDD